MSVIKTKWLGPTNRRGSRIRATSSGGISMTRPWDYSKENRENHDGIAWALAEKLCWNDSGNLRLVRGSDDNLNYYIPFYGDNCLSKEQE